LKKKILALGHTYTSPINRHKFEIAAKDKRFELLLVTPRKWKNYLTVTDNKSTGDENYETLFVDVKLGFNPALYLIPGLKTIINNFKPDLIYCEQEPICLSSMQTCFIAKSIPVILCTFENIDRKDFWYSLFKPIRFYTLRRASAVVAGSIEVAGIIRRTGFKRKIFISPHLGIHEDLFFLKDQNNSEDKKEDIETRKLKKEYKIGYFGRFVRQKGVETLLNAVKILNGTVNYNLTFVGDGPLKESYLKTFDESGKKDLLLIKPAVPHERIPEYLRELDVLVLPSLTTKKWKEQFGHVIIEAMACGVPVIGSSSGEIPNVIGNAGLVFKEGDEQDLAEKLLMLYKDNELRKDLIKKGLERVKFKFTDTQIANNMISVFETSLNMERITPNTLEQFQ